MQQCSKAQPNVRQIHTIVKRSFCETQTVPRLLLCGLICTEMSIKKYIKLITKIASSAEKQAIILFKIVCERGVILSFVALLSNLFITGEGPLLSLNLLEKSSKINKANPKCPQCL